MGRLFKGMQVPGMAKSARYKKEMAGSLSPSGYGAGAFSMPDILADLPTLSLSIDPPATRADAIDAFTNDWTAAVESLVSGAQGALQRLDPGGIFKLDPNAPGANGPFENIFRAMDVAVNGANSQWAAQLGLDQATAMQIVRDFQQGLITEQVKALIDVPALTAQIQQQQVGKQLTDAFVKSVAEAAGADNKLVEAMIPFAGKDAAAPEAVLTAADTVATTYTDNLKPKLQDLMTTTLDPLITAFGKIADALDTVNMRMTTFAEKAAGIVIPPALMPGSPTPFETGLRGIADALREAKSEMGGAFSGRGAAQSTTINVYVNGQQQQTRDAARSGVLAGARAAGLV
jgi:hypothetical protein